MNKFSLLGIMAAVGLLAGCASPTDEIRGMQPTGVSFTEALATEYRDFALFETDQMYDFGDGRYFAQKGLAAADGEVVLPESLENWDLPDSAIGDLSAGRTRLVQLLDANGRTTAPGLAAHAQARFDCWVEQQEENHQAAHIAACREEFLAALAELEIAMAPEEEEAVVVPIEPEEFRIFFEFDRYQLADSINGQEIIDQVLAEVQELGMPAISLIGHADRAGPGDYNFGLSLRRADAVRQALIDGGVPADRISVAGRGEEDPLVPTADDVPLQENRRVEILIQ
ncbi:OmpA family protein [Rhodospirillaceae bacterium SYSU D60014]|uniref:OmpA family protein n=1 Tax=Virgifigura deserti TaxID=2268457 RepID=UPI000E665264